MKNKSCPVARWLLLTGVASVLTACASTGRHVTDWGEITLAPGDTGTCQSNPCRVFFQMPAGDGTYRVTANQVKVGDFPAGKTVSLGSFYESSSIKLPDTGVPPTYIYVPEAGGNPP